MAKKRKSWFRRVVKLFASLPLAIFIILAIGAISAVGTIVEAQYNAHYAQTIVYHSIWMKIALGLLCTSLIAVMIDRWPWKRHHTGFVLAHCGILILLFGCWVTKKFGVDGTMRFGIGQKNRYVNIPEEEIMIYASSTGQRYVLLDQRDVQFLKNPPSPDKPVVFQLGDKKLKVIRYYPFAVRDESVVASTQAGAGPAVRFQIQNPHVSFTKWLLVSSLAGGNSIDLGPAKVVISSGGYEYTGGNVIVLQPSRGDKLHYAVYTQRRGGLVKQGLTAAGKAFATGWMGLEFRVLKYIPHAERKVVYERRQHPNSETTSAIKVVYDGVERWVGLDSLYKFFTDSNVYVFSYGHKRVDIGFNMQLEKFTVDHYQGTMRASAYQSLVKVQGLGEHLIYMNHPLKYRGYTFYQASFEQDKMGRPTASILSANHDPGRPLKYLGSLLIVLGSAILFWFKRMKLRKKRKLAQKSSGTQEVGYEQAL